MPREKLFKFYFAAQCYIYQFEMHENKYAYK